MVHSLGVQSMINRRGSRSTGQLSHCVHSQEAESYEGWGLISFLLFPFQPWTPAHGLAPSTFRMVPPNSINSLWKQSHRHAQKCVS